MVCRTPSIWLAKDQRITNIIQIIILKIFKGCSFNTFYILRSMLANDYITLNGCKSLHYNNLGYSGNTKKIQKGFIKKCFKQVSQNWFQNEPKMVLPVIYLASNNKILFHLASPWPPTVEPGMSTKSFAVAWRSGTNFLPPARKGEVRSTGGQSCQCTRDFFQVVSHTLMMPASHLIVPDPNRSSADSETKIRKLKPRIQKLTDTRIRKLRCGFGN